MAGLRVLALAVASGRVGHVFLRGGELLDWGLSRLASASPERAALHAQKLIERFKPDVVVTENVPKTSTKSSKTRAIIETLSRVAGNFKLLDVRTRPRNFPNKYAEAEFLKSRFPELSHWLPRKRKLWEPEPRSVTVFEALGLALCVMEAESSF